MNKMLNIILGFLPKKWVTYASALAGVVLGALYIEQGFPEAGLASLWPDLPEQWMAGLTLLAGAGGAVGLRRGQQKAENAAVAAVTEAAAMPAKDVTAAKNKLVGLINSRESGARRGSVIYGNLLVLCVMSAAVLVFCGCGLVRARQGVPVSAAKKYADSIEKITEFNTECAIQGKLIAGELMRVGLERTCPDGHKCLTDEEAAAIAAFLDRFSEVDDDDLEQIRQAVADLRLAIETAERTQ